MSSRIYKNSQVNIGVPFTLKSPLNFNTIKQVEFNGDTADENAGDNAPESAQSILENARTEAEAILREARAEARRIIDAAEKEIQHKMMAAEQEASQKGYERGCCEAQKQYEDLIAEAEFIRESARTEYKEVLAGIESDAVDVILDVAKKVIGIEISFNKEDVLYLVKQAFEKCANKERIVLKLAAEDYDFAVENKNRLLAMVEGIGELEIKKDVSLKEGGCILETPYGCVDAGIQTKLKKIEDAFRELIGE